MASRSLWKGQLKLGDALVPVKLVNASAPASTFDVGFHFAHRCSAKTLTRINKKTWCGRCEKAIATTVRVLEYAKDRHVEITNDELKACAAVDAGLLEIVAVLDRDRVDPVYVDSTAYLVPDGAGASTAYNVLRMAIGSRVVIASVVLNKRTAFMALTSAPGGVVAYVLRTREQVRDINDVAREHNVELGPQRRDDVRRLQQQLDTLNQRFTFSEVRDDYAQRVRAMVERKHSQFSRPARRRAAVS